MDVDDGRHEPTLQLGSSVTDLERPVRDPRPPGSAGVPATTGIARSGSQGRRGQQQFWLALGHDPMRAVLFGLLLAAVFGVLGAVASLGGSTTYRSTTVMLIDDPYQLALSGDQNEFVKLDALRYKYAELVNTDPIAGPVATELGLPVGSVIAAASTQVPFDGLAMDVVATWNTPRGAQVLSQALANEVTTYVRGEDTTNHIPQNDRFTLLTIDPAASAVAEKPSKSRAVTLAIGLAVLGFALGFLATQLVRYLR
ncbi:MAG TPA: hypothetical protein VMR97_08945 [Acidimicrobiales bacterium]|nr:hypothetical protein [Acidimicrobiales bacterium]